MTKVSVSGHRPFQKDKKTGAWISKLAYEDENGMYIDGNSKHLYSRLVALFSAWLKANPDVEYVIQGCALGWDLATGRAAIELGIPVHSYVPFRGHGETWKSFYRQEHQFVLSKSAKIFVPDKTPEQSEIGAMLLQRNKDMVNAADKVVVLWNGSNGGTGHCTRYAQSEGKPIVNLWGNWVKYR